MSVRAHRVGSVAPVRDAGGSVRHELRAVRVVWQREVLLFYQNRIRIVSAIAQPVLFLFVLGTGLSPVVAGADGGDFDFRKFLFPGALAMTVMFPAVVSGVSVAHDREFGFLREMLVAPVRRSAIVLGKCFGGATVALGQGVIMVALGGLLGIPYSAPVLLMLLVISAVTAFALAAFGMLVASRMRSMDSFQGVLQLLLAPILFLSGAFFPLSDLPDWLSVLTKLNPLSYAVDAMRRVVFSVVTVPESLDDRFGPGITWDGWLVPVAVEIGMVLALGVGLFALAVVAFSRPD